MLNKRIHTDSFYTQKKIHAYLRNKLPASEKRQFEKLLSEDEFLRDAVEGIKFSEVKNTHRRLSKIVSDVDMLTGSVRPKLLTINGRIIALAAMLLLFICVSYFWVVHYNKPAVQIAKENTADTIFKTQTDRQISNPESTAEIVNEKPGLKKEPPEKNIPEKQTEVKTTFYTDTVSSGLLNEQAVVAQAEDERIAEETEPTDIKTEDSGLAKNGYDEFTSADADKNMDSGQIASTPAQNNDAEKLDEIPASETANTIYKEKDKKRYKIVEQMPQFPGGEKALNDFIQKNITYPDDARNNNVEGEVFVQFVVDTDGSISNVTVKKGIGSGCDEEAIRVVSIMPKWEPAKKGGEPVKMSYTLPVIFKLQ